MKLRSKKAKTAFLKEVYSLLFDLYGELRCTLDYTNPLELMVADNSFSAVY